MDFNLSNYSDLRKELDDLKEALINLFFAPEIQNYYINNKYNNLISNALSSNVFVIYVQEYCFLNKIPNEKLPNAKDLFDIANYYYGEIDKDLKKNSKLLGIFENASLDVSNKNIYVTLAETYPFVKYSFQSIPYTEYSDIQKKPEKIYNDTLFFTNKISNDFLKNEIIKNCANVLISLINNNNINKDNYLSTLSYMEKLEKDRFDYITRKFTPYISQNESVEVYLLLDKLSWMFSKINTRQIKNHKDIVLNLTYDFLNYKDKIIESHKSFGLDFKSAPVFNKIEMNMNEYILDKKKNNEEYDLIYSYMDSLLYYSSYFNNLSSRPIETKHFKGKITEKDNQIIFRLNKINNTAKEIEHLWINKESNENSSKKSEFTIEDITEKNEEIEKLSIIVSAKKNSVLGYISLIQHNDLNTNMLNPDSEYDDKVINNEDKWVIYAKQINMSNQRLFTLVYKKNNELNKEEQKEFRNLCRIGLTEIFAAFSNDDRFDPVENGLPSIIDNLVQRQVRAILLNKRLNEINHNEHKIEKVKRKI